MKFHQCKTIVLAALAASLAPLPAPAEVLYITETAFAVRHEAEFTMKPAEVFNAMTGRISEWWTADHSWGGDATKLYFKTGSGGYLAPLRPLGITRPANRNRRRCHAARSQPGSGNTTDANNADRQPVS